VGKFNKNAARRVRVAGKILPFCMARSRSSAIEVDPKQISRILFSETGHNTIFDVAVGDQAAAKAMIVDWQREPLKDQLIHIDLKRIALDKLLQVSVRVKLIGYRSASRWRAHPGPGATRSRDRVPACDIPNQSTWM